MRRARLVLLAAVIVPAACRSPSSEPPPVAPSPAGDPLIASMQAVQRRMHVRYAHARLMIVAIARSDLDDARANAQVLAEVAEPQALPVWQPYVDAIQRAARETASAADLGGAAAGAALIGARCAGCHVATHAHVHAASEARPEAGPRIARQMVGHQWAATEMWQGLMAPSDERWQAGAEMLIAMPPGVVAEREGATLAESVDDMARVRMFGRRALAPMSNADRGDLYGELLTTCVRCHASLRDR